jgi:hypothetical protein
MLFSRTYLKDKSNVFTLGDRILVLTDPEPGIIIPQVAEDKNLVSGFFFYFFIKRKLNIL